jgi:ABC-type transport system involved in multi-copper enzyme maturation permease subunit
MMRNQIASELRKLTSTRSVITMLAAMLAFVTLGVVATVTDNDPSNLNRPLEQQPFLLVPLTIVPLFGLLLGIRSFTDEFRHGSIVPTLLAKPNRERVLGAKIVSTAVGGIAFATAAVGVAFAVGIPLLMGRGVEVTGSIGPLVEIAGRLIGVTVLWTAIGVGLGLAIRHQVAAIAGVLIWMLAGEQILSAFMPGVARYFPGAAGSAIVGVDAAHLLAPGIAAVVLTGWAVAATVAGGSLMHRRDIA